MKEFLSNTLITTANTLHNQAQKLGEIKRFPIDCSKLKEFLNEIVIDSVDFKELFIQLKPIKGPCVYWYKIIEPKISSKDMLKAFELYSKSGDRKRAVPALKSDKTIDFNSQYLYVGKIKRDFYGRVIQHLGCHSVARTQGLQLYYWAQALNLQLELNVFEFDRSMENILPVVEFALAKELKPLIGKHK